MSHWSYLCSWKSGNLFFYFSNLFIKLMYLFLVEFKINEKLVDKSLKMKTDRELNLKIPNSNDIDVICRSI